MVSNLWMTILIKTFLRTGEGGNLISLHREAARISGRFRTFRTERQSLAAFRKTPRLITSRGPDLCCGPCQRRGGALKSSLLLFA